MSSSIPRLLLPLLVALLLAGCGGDDDRATPSATAQPTATPESTATPAATPATAPEVPSAVSGQFPGLPLEKIAAMSYNPDQRLLTLTTTVAPGAIVEGESVCSSFIEVALFAPDASIAVLANDGSPLATCTRE